jgi:serine/threonine-protein kinase
VSTFARGATLGRYRIERLLGSGAMGEVYLADDPQIGRRVALKTLRILGIRPEELPERRQRLLREARTAGRLIHPHVVTLFDAGEDGGFIYLAFEYVPGSDLSVRLGSGPPLTLGEALRLARETCAGLDHAHKSGIVHRDIKPSNLLVDAEGRLKISDFGIAKMSGQATELTVTGSVMGSPHYLSPEQIRGEELDGRSDLFSFGVVLYEMLARRRPFGGETLSTLIYQVLQADPPPLQGLRPDLPPRLHTVVARLLAKDREERFASAAAVSEELAAVAAGLPAAALAAPAGGTETIEGATRLLESRGAAPPLSPATGRAPGSGGSLAPAPMPVPATAEGWAAGPPPPPPPGAPAGAGFGPPVTLAAAGAVSPATAPAGPATAPAALGPGGTVVAPPAGLGTPPAGASVAATPAPGSSRRLVLPIAAGCLVLVAIAAGALYFLARGPLRSSPLLQALAERTGLERAAPGEPGEGTGAPSVEEPGEAGEVDPLDPGAASATGLLERPPSGAAAEDPAAAAGARRLEADPGPGPGPAVERPPGSAATSGRAPSSAEPPTSPSAAERRPAEPAAGSRSTPPDAPAPARPSSTSGAPAGAGSGAAGDTGTSAADDPSSGAAAEPASEPQPSTTGRAGRVPDAGLTSGLGLSFRVQPADAFVLVDGTVIGRAREWAPGGQFYLLPGPGTYDVTLRKGGMRDRTIRVVASADGPAVTPVAARLEPLPVDQVEVGDLEVHRVREGVAFKVEPRTARVLVDGRLMGPASKYSGGLGQRRWLELPRGLHRVSLIAPGRQRVDLAVEFTPGAVEPRKRIEVVLPPAVVR